MTEPENSRKTNHTATASLEILTGPARGTASWLAGSTLDVSLDETDMIRIAEAGSEPLENGVVARLHRSGESYEIEALEDNPLWINGERFDSKQLEQRDLIEFGDKGPLSRYRMYRQGGRLRRSLGDMLDDAIDYTRVSRKPRIMRLQRAIADFLYDFALKTTVIFRIGVIIALIFLTYIVYQQYRSAIVLQQQAETSAHQLEDFARSLSRAREEALRPADLNRLRQELGRSLIDTAERLEILEKRSAASRRVIAEATQSIVFLQGSFGFRDVETQRMLRYQTDEDGNPLFSLRGQPLLTLEGEGEVARREFTGTAFLVSESGALLTNRHVALPWEDETSMEALIAQGMEPVIFRFIGYVPGIESAFPVELLKASDESDLALLQCSEVVSGLPHIKIGDRQPQPGDEVIVMGYPTGLRAMLAQTGENFLAELQDDGSLDFWQVAERLSQAEFIRPLASRGIISQRSETTVVYDADTTHGGSGGPVLDTNGNAIAINTAIIPEYGGSNFGIAVEYARRLLAEAGIKTD
ncbi:MAG: trypsin-like peptidase domain-containing protein [Gammaproteobacteria bacterium]|nr:MAG: serine protease [Gammaproteobacteria bacterium]UCH39557.1 MAG: trypsin-like peptidase domain-containing protein [Gammaproteobacteria bacterium]